MFQSTLLTCQLIIYLSISHFLSSVQQLTIISTVEGNYLQHGVSQAIVYLEREPSVSFLQCLLLSSWQKTELLPVYNTLEWPWPWKTKSKKLQFRVTIPSGVNPGLTIPSCMTLGMGLCFFILEARIISWAGPAQRAIVGAKWDGCCECAPEAVRLPVEAGVWDDEPPSPGDSWHHDKDAWSQVHPLKVKTWSCPPQCL